MWPARWGEAGEEGLSQEEAQVELKTRRNVPGQFSWEGHSAKGSAVRTCTLCSGHHTSPALPGDRRVMRTLRRVGSTELASTH